MAHAPRAPQFDAHYYATGCGAPYRRDEGWLAFFDRIAARIVDALHPARVLDAGCAMGFLVEALRKRGVDAWGVDISDYAISQVHESIRGYCRVGTLADPPDGHYDLIVCIEVLEHMAAADAERAVAHFCAHADQVLFSSSPDDLSEPTHINVRPPEYWASLFARHGFAHDLGFDASVVTEWAALFTRGIPPADQLVGAYERALAQARKAARGQGAREDDRIAMARLQRETQDARDEAARQGALVAAYERGRFIRLMKWLKGRR